MGVPGDSAGGDSAGFGGLTALAAVYGAQERWEEAVPLHPDRGPRYSVLALAREAEAEELEAPAAAGSGDSRT